jgi:RNA polymerase sigma-70 factor (ECF subfamily)
MVTGLMLLSDEALMAKVAAGDQRAFANLLDRHSQRVLNVLYRIVLSRADAEDLCQEVFERMWKQAPSWRDEAKLSTWLYRVASNLAFNFCRRVQQRMDYSDDIEGLVEQQEDVLKHRQEPLGQDEHGSAKLLTALSRLPENQRAALAFRFYQDFAVNDIADIMGLSVKAVESLLMRAKARLREQLGDLQ